MPSPCSILATVANPILAALARSSCRHPRSARAARTCAACSIIRAALADEALVLGLKCRIADMQGRLDRLHERTAKRRQIAKGVMVELDLKRLTAPDFSASIRSGMPALVVLNEDAVPSIYWQPSEPRLKRQELAYELKQGAEIEGVTLSDPEPVLSVRTR